MFLKTTLPHHPDRFKNSRQRRRSLWLPVRLLAIGLCAITLIHSPARATSPSPVLPEGLVWETNNDAPLFASPQAVKGGTFRTFILSFPLTLRTVGPDSNSSFRGYLDANKLSLVGFHPNTLELIPQLATHWAYDADGRTVYYKLDPEAQWSDGEPVTAEDYLFTLAFMRSKHIVAPWYNNHYRTEIEDVIRFDDYTIAVIGAKVKPKEDLILAYGIGPTPAHFHQLDENWVKRYNWTPEPNTGPYQISKVKKGKSIEFKRKTDWWAKDKRYFRHRYNVDKFRISVIRDLNVAYQHFLKGELDSFSITFPVWWHERARGVEYDNGYIHKLWFYTDSPQPSVGMWLNTDKPILSDRRVRKGLAHAMNIDKVINTILRKDYFRLPSHYTGYGEYSNESLRPLPFDLKKSAEYLDQAGWVDRNAQGVRVKDGQPLRLVVNYSTKQHTDRLVILREEAKKAGVDLVLQLLDPSTSFKNVLEKKHDIAWSGWSTGLRPAFWQHYHSDNAHKPQTNNITNLDNPEIDALIMAYRTATTKAERVRLSRELQSLIHEQTVFIPTFMVPYERFAYWRWLKMPPVEGTRLNGTGLGSFSPGLFWIDEQEKAFTLKARKQGTQLDPIVEIDETYKKL